MNTKKGSIKKKYLIIRFFVLILVFATTYLFDGWFTSYIRTLAVPLLGLGFWRAIDSSVYIFFGMVYLILSLFFSIRMMKYFEKDRNYLEFNGQPRVGNDECNG